MTSWWQGKSMRMVQTNLREIDAILDVEAYIRSLKEFSADVVLFNVGGIVANYPTDLAYHYRNPYLQDDLVGKVLTRVHQEGIRFLARFDFSKLNEIYAKQHPEWLYSSPKGDLINYNGQVHTCINGDYQQGYALEILTEALDRYPVDGVFFNMIGYVTRDYDHVYHGICQCQNCRQRFDQMYGLPLPVAEDAQDPIFLKYEDFKRVTSRETFYRIRDLVKNKNPEAAICTYTHEGVDIYRHESNSGIERSQPEWVYSASENVKQVLGSWESMGVANAAVHFIDFPFRHAAVSPHLTQRRLAQNLASGGGMDYYVIGHLDNQDDRACFEGVKALFAFHQKNEDYYNGLKSVADVALVMPSESFSFGSLDEFRGIFKILTEEHVLFDVLHDSVLETGTLERLKRYQILVLPDMRLMSRQVKKLIDDYVLSGGKVLGTGFTAAYDSQGVLDDFVGLQCAGVARIQQVIEFSQGMYFRIRPEDKQTLHGFDDLDIVHLNGDLLVYELNETTRPYLGYIPPHMFGPPEKCYYEEETDIPGLINNRYGEGSCVLIPWRIGAQHYQFSTHTQSLLLKAALKNLLQLHKSLHTNALPLVEIQVHQQKSTGNLLVNLVNISGQSGAATLAPVEMQDIEIRIRCPNRPAKVRCLWAQQDLEFFYKDDIIQFIVPKLSLLESIIIYPS
ncbi:alpha-amylase family protein [Chloroflexota bacterium]